MGFQTPGLTGHFEAGLRRGAEEDVLLALDVEHIGRGIELAQTRVGCERVVAGGRERARGHDLKDVSGHDVASALVDNGPILFIGLVGGDLGAGSLGLGDVRRGGALAGFGQLLDGGQRVAVGGLAAVAVGEQGGETLLVVEDGHDLGQPEDIVGIVGLGEPWLGQLLDHVEQIVGKDAKGRQGQGGRLAGQLEAEHQASQHVEARRGEHALELG